MLISIEGYGGRSYNDIRIHRVFRKGKRDREQYRFAKLLSLEACVTRTLNSPVAIKVRGKADHFVSVPEIWRYDGQDMQIYELKSGKYVKTAGSFILSRLTGALLSEFIEMTKTQGHTAARHAFRRRIHSM